MKRDSVKTAAGLAIIVLIVVATFLYGNAQRQSQLRHDQQVKAQQQAAAERAARQNATSQPKPAPSTAPSANGSQQPAPSAAIPDTGASQDALIPVALIGTLLIGLYRSRRALSVAIRTRN